MKLPLKAHRGPTNLTIRMTPLIDVIFLLLIFFIMTIHFQRPEGVLANRLPEKGGQSVTQQQDWEIVRLRIRLSITDGDMLRGVRYLGASCQTHSLVMRGITGTIRNITATHYLAKKPSYVSRKRRS